MTALAKQIAEKAELKSFKTPDEVREFPKGRLELMKIGGATIGRAIFEPGWRWATSVQPTPRRRAARRRIFNITSPACSGYEWTTEPNCRHPRKNRSLASRMLGGDVLPREGFDCRRFLPKVILPTLRRI